MADLNARYGGKMCCLISQAIGGVPGLDRELFRLAMTCGVLIGVGFVLGVVIALLWASNGRS